MDAVLPEALHDGIGKFIEYAYSFEPMAAPTVVLVPSFAKEAVANLAESAGQDYETVVYLLGVFLCYPLGLIMLALPYGKLKHLFSFILGAFLLQFTIGVQWIHHLISSLVAYAMFLILPAKIAKTAVPIWMMVYMTAGHLHRQYINYLGWDLDFTGPQMVLTMKLYALAYNLYDGQVIKSGKEERASKKCADVAVAEVPGIIEYLGYSFCFATVLAGPSYEYKYYADACDGSRLYDKNGKPLGKIPSNIWPTLRPLLGSLIFLGLFVVGSGKYPLLDPTDPQNNTPVLISAELLAKPMYERYAYSWLALVCIRFKYYFAWMNAEGANNIWFAGFEGFDDKGNAKGWEVSNNMDPVKFETAPNLKTLSSVWNKKTANWLAKYVYMRTNGSLFATYGMSAFWHGFYPGYYIFFMSVPLIAFCERIGRKKISPRFDSGNPWGWYSIVCRLTTSLIVQYMIQPFQLLAFDWSITNWKEYYFAGHLACIVFYVVVSQLPTPKKKEA